MKKILLVAVAAVLVGQVLDAKEPSREVTFYVQGMTCGGCAAAVTIALRHITGVIDARVSYEKHQAVVTYDPAKIAPPAIARAAEERLPGYRVGTDPVPGTSSNSCSRVVAATPSAIKPNEIQANRVTFYEVGLVCPAAPKIGCGSRSKPILQSLAADRRVAGAWLNEAGTKLAVGWKQKAVSLEELNRLLAGHGIAANAVSDAASTELLASFHSGQGWFDAASVDRLSEHEAGVIAARLVKRLADKVTLTAEQRTTLVNSIEQSCRNRFIAGAPGDSEKEMLAAAREAHLDSRALAALREVAARGYRPLPGEE
ncbi:MAG TPA: heavy metal-associated domain-containing protein [Thermoanaerobaculia bacterium]|nr:heavy metal-associated domain-containing protein [Thermoanaerobaculia bacterium]